MSDIQKETERIHQGIVESLSFSEALAKRDEEIERLRELLRNVDDGLDDYWVTTKEGVAWICARHEALGE